MGAQGFKPKAIKEAMRLGDKNGDGDLDFEEFVSLVASIGGARGDTDTTRMAAGAAGNMFPFALVASGYRLKQRIDALDPAVRERFMLAEIAKGEAAAHRLAELQMAASASRTALPALERTAPVAGLGGLGQRRSAVFMARSQSEHQLRQLPVLHSLSETGTCVSILINHRRRYSTKALPPHTANPAGPRST